MASASLLKAAPVIDKTDFVKGQPLRLSSPSVSLRARTSTTLTVSASYADELVKTAVLLLLLLLNNYTNTK